jgi:transposase
MSSNPYGLDLREKVIKFLSAGNSQRLASKVFNISKTTVNTWHVRYKKDGNYLPKKKLGARSKIDISKFIEYVKNNPDATSDMIGKHFGMTNSGARYYLKKLGFSYKKKHIPMWRQAKKSELSI